MQRESFVVNQNSNFELGRRQPKLLGNVLPISIIIVWHAERRTRFDFKKIHFIYKNITDFSFRFFEADELVPWFTTVFDDPIMLFLISISKESAIISVDNFFFRIIVPVAWT